MESVNGRINFLKILPMTENDLATIAVDICYRIHKTLGPGLPESVYESAFAYELDNRGVPYTRQQGFSLKYEDVVMDVAFRSDIIMDNKLLIELKSIEHLDKVHHKIVLTYLKLTGIKLGLLVNFNEEFIKNGIHRKIWGKL
jgi:GxxExxY protein